MKLLVGFLGEKASTNWVQLCHRKTAIEYGVRLPESVFAAIDTMRKRVNVMKHDSGLELDHFISESDYQQAIAALEQFWKLLAVEESYHPNVT